MAHSHLFSILVGCGVATFATTLARHAIAEPAPTPAAPTPAAPTPAAPTPAAPTPAAPITAAPSTPASDATPPPVPFEYSTDAFKAAAEYAARHSGRAMLVMRDGKILFEQYDNSWTASRPHPLASGTKSFTGIMAMMAVQDGLITLDEHAADTLTEWASDPRKRQITIRQLLTLSSGLEPGDKLLGGRGGGRLLGEGARKRAERLGTDPKPNNHFEAVLTIPAKRAPGESFDYGPSHFYAFGALLQRKLGSADLPQKSTMEYLQQRVFNDLNIQNPLIGKDASNCPNLPGGALLTAREWAKFGQFVLDQGSVRAADGTMTQRLRPDLLAQCFIPSEKNPSYGLTWWLNINAESTLINARVADGGGATSDSEATGRNDGARDTQRARIRDRIRDRAMEARREQEAQRLGIDAESGRGIRVYMAAGLGKQRLYVLPDQDLVVVRFAEATDKGRAFSDAEYLGLALGRIPAKESAGE